MANAEAEPIRPRAARVIEEMNIENLRKVIEKIIEGMNIGAINIGGLNSLAVNSTKFISTRSAVFKALDRVGLPVRQ